MKKNHASDLQLVNLLAGLELEKTVSEHISGCEQCRSRMAQIQEDDRALVKTQEFRARLTRLIEESQPEKEARSTWFTVPALATAALGIVLLAGLGIFFLGQDNQENPTKDRLAAASGTLPDKQDFIPKGGLSAMISVKRGEQVLQGTGDFIYQEHDIICPTIFSPAKGFVTLFDQAGGSLEALPDHRNLPIGGQTPTITPKCLELSCDAGEEQMMILFTPEPLQGKPRPEPGNNLELKFPCRK